MSKNKVGIIKIIAQGGSATPGPPIGPALGGKGVNIMDFCKQFNAQTQDRKGKSLPVHITIYSDKSFSLLIKAPTVSTMLMEAVNLKKGSATPNRDKVASLNWNQIRQIAGNKITDLNCFSIESAMKMLEGSARSMGIIVNDKKIP